jgi:hypothetical protein
VLDSKGAFFPQLGEYLSTFCPFFSFVSTITVHGENKRLSDPENPLLFDVATFADYSGFVDTADKIFVTVSSSELNLPLAAAVMVTSAAASKWAYSKPVDKVVPKKANDGTSDPSVLAHGLATLFKQFHEENLRLFLQHLCSFSCRQFEDMFGGPGGTAKSGKPADNVPVDAVLTAVFAEQVSMAAKWSRKDFEVIWPVTILSFSRTFCVQTLPK